MGIAAIFARGSCKALKWTALLGVVFALGAGTVAAQITATGIVGGKVAEGARVTLTVGGTVAIDAGAGAQILVVTAAAEEGSTAGSVTVGEADDFGSVLSARITLPATVAAIAAHPVTGTITWLVGSDVDAEDEAVTLMFTATIPAGTAVAPADMDVTIDDAQTQRFLWSPAEPMLAEAGMVMVTLQADPPPRNLEYTPSLNVDTAGYSVDPAELVALTGTAPVSLPITISAPADDQNEVDDMIVVRAVDAGTVIAELEITVTDSTMPTTTTGLGGITLTSSYGNGGIKIDARDYFKVHEGASEEIAVSIRGEVPGETAGETDLTLMITGEGKTVFERDTGYGTLAEAEDFDLDLVTSAGALVFTFPANTTDSARTHTVSRTFIFDANEDVDAENEGVHVTIAAQPDNIAGSVPGPFVKQIVIDDDETQTYAFELGRREEPMEGEEFVITLETEPDFESNSRTLTLKRIYTETGKSAGRDYRLSPSSVVLDVANPSMDITVDALDNDKNRVTDTITIEAYRGSAGSSVKVASIDIEVEDVDTLPAAEDITAVAMDKAEDGNEVTEVEEGGDPVYLTVTVDRGSGSSATTEEELTVHVRAANPSQASDYEIDPVRFTLEEVTGANGEQSTDVEIELTALSDNDVGTEELVLNLELSGDPDRGTEVEIGTFAITIVDQSAKNVEPKPEDEAYPAIMEAIAAGAGDDGLNPGESFMVKTSDLFTVMSGYTANYGVSVEGSAVSVAASTEMVTVTADSAGEAKVTVTATAQASSSFIPSQQTSNVASITFPVMVVDADLVIMLSAPEDMNITEGMSAMVTATANRAVDADMMVELIQTAGTASPADYTVGPIMIMAGEMMGTTMVMAVADDMMEEMEMLTLEGRVGTMQTNTVSFTIWDVAVPALPLVAQLLLAAFLGVGAYRRRYLRR